MKIRKAVITAAGPSQRSLPLQTLVDRDGVEKPVLRIIVEEALRAGVEEIAIVVSPGDETPYARVAGDHAGRLRKAKGVRPMSGFRLATFLLTISAISPAQSVTFTEYPTPARPPVDQAQPWGITLGPDGAVWFTETATNAIGSISMSGSIVTYPIPTTACDPYGIVAGPDGALWFTELSGDKIGRITTNGVITEYPIPTACGAPWDITAGPDGALWFTESGSLSIYCPGKPRVAKIGRITTTGLITEWSLMPDQAPLSALSTYPTGITAGPDAALWFAEQNTGIGRITTTGSITQFLLPTNSDPYGITAGPDGALWFTEDAGNRIGRITTGGVVTEYTTASNAGPSGITAGPDGAVWFAEENGNKIGRITMAGELSEYAIPTTNSEPVGITTGPDGALWFTELNGNKIGRAALVFLTPIVTAVTNSADGHIETIQSNSWVTIYGSNLAPTGSGRTWGEQDIVNGRLPVSLDGVGVTIDGRPAYMEYISPTQLNVLAPDDPATGPVNVIVSNGGSDSAAFSALLQLYSPAFFTFSPPNQEYIAATIAGEPGGALEYLAPSGALGLGASSRPAVGGDIVELYATGFGPTNPAPPDGQVFFGAYPTATLVAVTIGGLDATVLWAGLSAAGLYQLNVIVPAGLPNGDALVVTTVGGVQSQDGTFIPVQN